MVAELERRAKNHISTSSYGGIGRENFFSVASDSVNGKMTILCDYYLTCIQLLIVDTLVVLKLYLYGPQIFMDFSCFVTFPSSLYSVTQLTL